MIDESLKEILDFNRRAFNQKDRLEYLISTIRGEFIRKYYMNIFKDISAATASRDLKKGVELELFQKIGDKNKTKYNL
ncbi:MAG: hypothetical protein WBG71_02545 [Leeuwenhoekiella sp.]